MKKIIVFLLFLLFAVNTFALLRIGIIGDQTGSSDLQKSYEILQQGCNTISCRNPQMVLHVGDIIESSKSDDEIRTNFKTVVGYLNNKGVPWYLAAGDHDVNPPGDYTPGSKDYSKRNLFESLLSEVYSKRKPPLSISDLYYSFNFEGYHFICLYSEDTLRVDPRWGNIFMDKISDQQFQWLKNDLAKTVNTKGTIVYLHQPMWYNVTGWQRVHDLLKKYNVLTVIAGHFHYNQDEGYKDGIKYLVVGSTGGNIKSASDNAGGLYHVTMLTLTNDNEIGIELISIDDSNKKLSFTDRENMDRIQAIDTMITSFPYGNFSGKAVQANPIVIPIDVRLSQDGKSWSSAYLGVEPGIGVSVSNLSSVTLQGPPYQKAPESVSSPGGVRIEFRTIDNQVFWDQILYDSGSKAEKTL